MQQKLTIKVNMECESCRNKALKIASSVKGVSSVAIEGNEKDRVVVKGEDVDTVCLGRMLKKKFRGVTVLTVEEDKPPKPQDGKGKGKDQKDKDKDKDKDKVRSCTVCIVPACYNNPCHKCSGQCGPCSRCQSSKCHGDCKPCTRCEALKCHGDCKACVRCGSYKCSGQCASSICVRPPQPTCYGQCPPWISCPSCCVKRPYDPYCYRVVYDSCPDSCSIQ
ncbi:uncharacterized protein LOC129301807 isoform X2 [Prosopis cineraria]|uniref:uncharacterized protein LOC129301807 isoform X2 n=1 Tax=Prosopis cineraria TaxID=364024 RepID=UPI00240E9ECF|nr:uncharacterized protein LOC129301807 isoform X2 [Prosopis cineraria]